MNGKNKMKKNIISKTMILFLLSHIVSLQVIAKLEKHLVEKNETLMSISEKIYGSLYCYPHIKAFNLGSINNDDKLRPGTMLKIPERSSCVPNKDVNGQIVSITKRIYTVQLASFDNLEAAQKKVELLKVKKISGIVRRALIANKEWYRVQVGEFIGYSKARARLEKVIESSESGLIMSMTLQKMIMPKIKLIVTKEIPTAQKEPLVVVDENIISDGKHINSNTVSQMKKTATKRFQKIRNQ